MQKLCETYQVPLIINDHVEIAKQCKASRSAFGTKKIWKRGEHGEILGPKMILGVSARTVEQAVQAERAGADYLGVGAVFQTSTKTDAKEISHAILKEIRESVNIPVVAIGGIGKQNIEALAGGGIAGVALVSVSFCSGRY
ncbi:MAG: thiamine phosphate synthase [Blautia faecis]